MSSTLAPRERSLTGRANPCRIGPTAVAPPRCRAELVGDVAGVEVREDEHVRAPGDGAQFFELLRGDGGAERRVGLQFAVDRERWRALARERERTHHLVDVRVRSTPLGRERQQRDAWLFGKEHAGACRRRQRDVGKLVARRVGVHRAIRENQDAFSERHQEEARRRRDSGRKADRQHGGLDHARRRVRGAGHHGVGVAGLYHQAGVEQRLRGEAARHLRVRVRPAGKVGGRIRVEAIARLRIGRAGPAPRGRGRAGAAPRRRSVHRRLRGTPPAAACRGSARNRSRERSPRRHADVSRPWPRAGCR